MNLFLKAMSAILITSAAMASGSTVGNGGKGVFCKDSSGQIASAEVLDYYELRINGGSLLLDPNLADYKAILNDLFLKWMMVAPVRMAQYQQWLTEFGQDAGFYPDIVIPEIPDTGPIFFPANCEIKQIAFQKIEKDIFPGDKRYIISKNIWDMLSEVQKAGLVLHEFIYREAINAGHTTSSATRSLNRFFASSLPDSMLYSSFISKMPLNWTEYGGGLILKTISQYQTNPYSPPFANDQCEIFSDGYITKIGDSPSSTCVISEINGDIISNNLKMMGINNKQNFSDGYIFFQNDLMKIGLGRNMSEKWINIERIQIKSSTFSLDFSLNTKTTYLEIRSSDQSEYKMAGPLILDKIGDCTPNEEIQFDPINSWFRTKAGSIITGINKMVMCGASSSHWLFNKVEAIHTASGQVWIFENGDFVLSR